MSFFFFLSSLGYIYWNLWF